VLSPRYALRNTLVAKDLEQASRIAYGTRDRRFARVVTVAGQLIAGAGRHSCCGAAHRENCRPSFGMTTPLSSTST